MKQIGIAGEYKVVVNRPDGSIKQETGWFDNLITNAGLDRLAGNMVAFNRARVGTGTSAPSVLQTALDAQIAASNTKTAVDSVVNSGAPNYETTHTVGFVFNQGAVVGNITEVGVSHDNTASLFSRALILDEFQNPISIAVTAIDQLTVFYRLRVKPPLSDFSGTVNISGTPYSYVGRVGQVGSFANSTQLFTLGSNSPNFGVIASGSTNWVWHRGAGATLGAITGAPTGGSGSGSGFSSVTTSTYTNGTYNRNSTINLGINDGNYSGGLQTIGFYTANTSVQWQFRFDTPIPKDNTKTLSLTFNMAWNRL